MTNDAETAITSPESEATDGHSTEFETAFKDLTVIAYRVAYRILGSRVDAEDVSQETLARAYLRWRRIRGHAEPWVAHVAGNLAIDAVRRRRTPPTPIETNHDVNQAALDRMVLIELLRTLPKRQRQVLVLRYLADQSEAATARALGCSTGSVKRHAHRALTTLRSLAPDDHDDPEKGPDDVRSA